MDLATTLKLVDKLRSPTMTSKPSLRKRLQDRERITQISWLTPFGPTVIQNSYWHHVIQASLQ